MLSVSRDFAKFYNAYLLIELKASTSDFTMYYCVMCCREEAPPLAPAWTDEAGMAAVVAQPLNSRYSTAPEYSKEYSTVQYRVQYSTVQRTVQYSTVMPLNSRVSLSCRAEARPPPSVRWTKDGIPIEEEVTRSLANTYRVRNRA